VGQQFCSFGRSADEACLAFLTGTVEESVHAYLPVDLTWATDSPETVPADTQAWQLPDGTVSVDSLHATWLLVVFVGCAAADHPLLLIDQALQATIDALLTAASITGDWAIFGRLVDGRIESFQQ
jgi:hypothetical protein